MEDWDGWDGGCDKGMMGSWGNMYVVCVGRRGGCEYVGWGV